MKCLGTGPIPARVMIVAEAPGREEDKSGVPFSGQSGYELTNMLHEVGIIRTECYITNVCKFRPEDNNIEHFIPSAKKDVTSDCVFLHDRMVKPVVKEGFLELLTEIERVKPNVIIALGNLSMWALTGKCSNPGEQDVPSGITAWRGSQLDSWSIAGRSFKVIPTYHPANILREWDNRNAAIYDLRRAVAEIDSQDWVVKEPPWRFITRPTYQEVMRELTVMWTKTSVYGRLDLTMDIETRFKHISCIGLGWSKLDAICIPFMCREKKEGYWLPEEEAEIIYWLSKILCHPNTRIINQNIQYDVQYIWRRWKFIPNVYWDVMTGHHVLFLVLPRGLAFQASLYCQYYRYWKIEGKDGDEKAVDPSVADDTLWTYNCKDCVYTFEIYEAQQEAIKIMGLEEQFQFQMVLWWAALESMLRGMRIDQAAREPMAAEFAKYIREIDDFLVAVCGHPLNPKSHVQMKKFFYDDLLQPKQYNKKTKALSCDEKSLEKIALNEPLLRPVISSILDHRTLGVFKSTFCESELDEDGRMRCTLDENGTDTLRFSSYENAFYTGMNMQNLPSDKSKAIGKAAKRVRAKGMALKLPNIRSLFLPDIGKTIFDVDLDRADLQVVVWESNDEMLKAALKGGVDIHLLNAIILGGKEPPPLEELVEGTERYKHWRSLYNLAREFAKVFIHGTNYGGSAKTMAENCGILVIEAERAQRLWFGAHPGIKKWHARTQEQLDTDRCVSNRFGYTCHFFDRVEALLGEALAWVPQSTVSCVINRGWVNLLLNVPDIEVLIQVHDSLVGQFDTSRKAEMIPLIQQNLRVVVPYDDPLIIPVGVKTSEVSWGACK